jgi:hypothetical protein
MDTLTIPAITREVKRLARQEPDMVAKAEYVQYVGPSKTPTPACILGVALYNLGVPMNTLRTNNKESIKEVLSVLFEDELAWDVFTEEIEWLSAVQIYQDDETNWRESIRLANKAVKATAQV